jgi:hypothetical protein
MEISLVLLTVHQRFARTYIGKAHLHELREQLVVDRDGHHLLLLLLRIERGRKGFAGSERAMKANSQ